MERKYVSKSGKCLNDVLKYIEEDNLRKEEEKQLKERKIR